MRNERLKRILAPWRAPASPYAAAGLIGAWGILLARGLGGVGLLDNNEGMYAAIGWCAVTDGNWIVPHLIGVPYIEKPPLLYWLLASSFAVLGKRELAARLVPLAASMFQLGLLLWFGRRIGRASTGRLAALILATSFGFLLFAGAVMFDGVLAAMLSGALLCSYVSIETGERRLLTWGGFWLGLAILAKGLVALALAGLVLACYCAWQPARRRWATLRFLAAPRAAVAMLLVAVPWHIAAALSEPGFAWFYFINEHLLRFLGLRQPRDFYTGSPLYYLPRLVLMLLPWSMLLPLTLGRGAESAPQRRFMLLALCVPAAFFTLSSAKANYYLLVVLPAAAWLIAERLEAVDFAGRGVRITAISVLSVLALSVPTLAIWISGGADSSREIGAGHFVLLGVVFSAGLIAAIRGLSRSDPSSVWHGVGLLALSLLPLADAWLIDAQARFSSRDVAAWIREHHPAAPVLLYRDFERFSSMAFYAGERIAIVDSASADLRWAQSSGRFPQVFTSIQELAALSHPSVVVVAGERTTEFEHARRAANADCRLESSFANGLSVYVCGLVRQ